MKNQFFIILVLLMSTGLSQASITDSNNSEINQLKSEITRLEYQVKQLQKKLEENKKILSEIIKQNRALRFLCRKSKIKIPRNMKRYASELEQMQSLKKIEDPLSIGQMGFIENVKIIQIQDANNALIEFEAKKPFFSSISRSLEGGRIVEVEPIMTVPAKKTSAWLKDFDTKKWADEQFIKRIDFVKIVGTKTYETAFGKKTVFLLEPYERNDEE